MADEAPAGNGDSPSATGTATEANSETESAQETGGDAAALKRALDKERSARRDAEKRAKALEPFEQQARQAEEASKSEAQKLTDALNEEKQGRTSAETELLRFRTAADKGVPLNLVRFLSGNNAEEVAESADLLLKEIGTKPTMPGRPRGGTPLANGKASDAEGSEDPLELIKQARSQRI